MVGSDGDLFTRNKKGTGNDGPEQLHLQVAVQLQQGEPVPVSEAEHEEYLALSVQQDERLRPDEKLLQRSLFCFRVARKAFLGSQHERKAAGNALAVQLHHSAPHF